MLRLILHNYVDYRNQLVKKKYASQSLKTNKHYQQI